MTPKKRTLTHLDAFAIQNTIYIRDLDFVRQRLTTAPKIKILYEEFKERGTPAKPILNVSLMASGTVMAEPGSKKARPPVALLYLPRIKY